MAYVYRFIDTNNIISYVGYTGQKIDYRIIQHFEKGHLPNECYQSISRIEYKEYRTKSDAQVMEVYYINLYKPQYNKQDKQVDKLTLEINDNKSWKIFREYKPVNSDKGNVYRGAFSKLLYYGLSLYGIYKIVEILFF